MKSKKGIQLNNAFSAVLILVLVAVLIIISIYMFTALQSVIPSSSGSIKNETGGGYINNTGYILQQSVNASITGFANPSIIDVYNRTSGLVIASGNYTLTGNTLKNATSVTWTNVSVSYTYTYDSSAQTSTSSMVTAFAGYPALIGLVGTIIFLGLVIGVLVASFAFGGKKGV